MPHTSRCDVNDDNEERNMMIMNNMLVVVVVMVLMPQCLIPTGDYVVHEKDGDGGGDVHNNIHCQPKSVSTFMMLVAVVVMAIMLLMTSHSTGES